MKFNFLNDSNGEQSSKRLFTFILVILFSTTIIANLFWKFSLRDSLEDWLCYLVIITFFGVLAEKFLQVYESIRGKKINNNDAG